MDSYKKLLTLTFAEYEGIGTWYEYLVKYRLFKKLRNIKTVLLAGLPQEYGIAADMLLFAFLVGGAAGGFCAGYFYRKLTEIGDTQGNV